MKCPLGLACLVCLPAMTILLSSEHAAAEAPVPFTAQQTPPVFASPAQVAYQDCITHSCRTLHEVKQIKKTVYEVREEPYCLKKLPPLLSLFHHHRCEDCDQCAECQCPRYRKVLVKKEVVCKEVCTSKCVVEEHVQRVPCH